MHKDNVAFRADAQKCLDSFYKQFPHADRERRAATCLRFLASSDALIPGKPEEWAGGVAYMLDSAPLQPEDESAMVDGHFAKAFGVTVYKVKKYAEKARLELDVLPVPTREGIEYAKRLAERGVGSKNRVR